MGYLRSNLHVINWSNEMYTTNIRIKSGIHLHELACDHCVSRCWSLLLKINCKIQQFCSHQACAMLVDSWVLPPSEYFLNYSPTTTEFKLDAIWFLKCNSKATFNKPKFGFTKYFTKMKFFKIWFVWGISNQFPLLFEFYFPRNLLEHVWFIPNRHTSTSWIYYDWN